MYELKKYKDFKRTFEIFGEKYILLKIERAYKSSYIVHLLYGEKEKPPFDVAVSREENSDFSIEYITFFIDKIVEVIYKSIKIILKEESLYFKFEKIPNCHLPMFNFKGRFDNFLFKNELVILKKEYTGEIYGYRLTEDNYILIDNNDNIIGIYLKNLSIDEMNSLKEANFL